MFKKDNWLLGIIIGILVPVIIFALLYLIINVFNIPDNKMAFLKPKNIPLTGIFFNMIPFRYYMVNLKYDKTGRGILLVSIIYAIIFFFLKINL